MDRKKLLILVLAALALVYFVALGTGLTNKREFSMDSAEAAFGWLNGLFAPSLDLDGLECDGVAVSKIFQLDSSSEGSASCVLRLRPQIEDDSDFRKTELRLAPQVGGGGQAPVVYLKASYGGEVEDFPVKRCAKSISKFRLEIEYTPAEPPRTTDECLIEDEFPVSFTITKGGGDLSFNLVCDECGDSGRSVDLRMR